jgi:membrane protease YdiL (CAAX protease family)
MRSTRLSTIIEIFKFPPQRRPCRKDIAPFFFSLGSLFLTGFLVWVLAFFAASFFVPPGEEFTITKPEGAAAWAGIAVLCLFTGYWEEGLFRVYFLTVCGRAGIKHPVSVLVSSLVFALCHTYEGPLGMINAGIAGILLSVVFLKTRSYHGPALAHAAYNLFAYIIA